MSQTCADLIAMAEDIKERLEKLSKDMKSFRRQVYIFGSLIFVMLLIMLIPQFI